MANTLREEITYLLKEAKGKIATYPEHRDIESWRCQVMDLSNALSLPDAPLPDCIATVSWGHCGIEEALTPTKEY